MSKTLKMSVKRLRTIIKEVYGLANDETGEVLDVPDERA